MPLPLPLPLLLLSLQEAGGEQEGGETDSEGDKVDDEEDAMADGGTDPAHSEEGDVPGKSDTDEQVDDSEGAGPEQEKPQEDKDGDQEEEEMAAGKEEVRAKLNKWQCQVCHHLSLDVIGCH